MADFIIEISLQGEVTSCSNDGASLLATEYESDLMDCNAGGDVEPACLYVLDTFKIDWRIVARNASGDYENRIATHEEKAKCAREIYFESESDFEGDERLCETYLVWQAASDLQYELDNGEG